LSISSYALPLKLVYQQFLFSFSLVTSGMRRNDRVYIHIYNIYVFIYFFYVAASKNRKASMTLRVNMETCLRFGF
jgi:hypothetical protein